MPDEMCNIIIKCSTFAGPYQHIRAVADAETTGQITQAVMLTERHNPAQNEKTCKETHLDDSAQLGVSKIRDGVSWPLQASASLR